jgi:N-acetylmuramoyl-L-alanine amidase
MMHPRRMRQETRGRSDRVPPFVRKRRRGGIAPHTSAILKLVGMLAVLTAMVTAGLLAMPDREGNAVATPTSPAVVIAPGGSDDTVAVGTAQDIPYDPRYAAIIVCIDPGHGGKDRGNRRDATDVAPAMEEALITLAIARELQDRLEQRGFTVVMTRSDDSRVNAHGIDTNRDGKTGMDGETRDASRVLTMLDEVQARIDRCNDAGAEVLLSLHAAGPADEVQQATGIWYAPDRELGAQSQLLATLTQEEMMLRLGGAGYAGSLPAARTLEPTVGLPADALDPHALLLASDDRVLKEPSAMPGVMVEPFSIVDDQDALFYTSSAGVAATVAALDSAIVRFVDMTLAAPSGD